MNPARTLGPALASNHYKSIWIYMVGPFIGTLLGSWTYRMIRVSDRPAHAMTPTFSFKLPRRKSSSHGHSHVDRKDSLGSVWNVVWNVINVFPFLQICLYKSWLLVICQISSHGSWRFIFDFWLSSLVCLPFSYHYIFVFNWFLFKSACFEHKIL